MDKNMNTFKVSEDQRGILFRNARKISSNLGAPFQNPVPLTTQDIKNELELVRSHEDAVSAYKDVLLELEEKNTHA